MNAPRRLIVPAAAALAAALATSATAQVNTGDIDEIFAWATPQTPGCSCAVALNGRTVASLAYGSADLERNVPITPDTIFDAGSLLKQFVAAAVLILADEGRLSLDDDIRTHLPELSDYGHKVTIDHLLTHTSGIRDWTGLLQLAPGNEDALSLILRQRGLNFPPGEEWSYTNSGFVLAREIVARVSGMPFADFTRTRLFEPLGMTSTSFRRDIRAVEGPRALAYNQQGGRWAPAMLLDQQRGGGGIFTTAPDLLRWNDALTNNRLGAFVSEKLREPAKLNNGRTLDYCRGLMLGSYRGAEDVWHTGSADGYKSYLGRFPEHGLSIAIMCNSGDGTDRTAYAHRIFDLFVPDAPASDDPRLGPPPAIPADALHAVTAKAGLFVNERTGDLLHLAIDRGRFRVAAGPGLEMIDQSRFRRWGGFFSQFMSGDRFELRFLSDDQFDLVSMEGDATRYRRANPYTPSPDELAAFAGRYESDEIGTTVEVAPADGVLTMRLGHMPNRPLDFKPIDRDTFQFSRITIRFARDNAGNVTGLDLTNPAVRNIRFTRANNGR